MLRFFGGLLFLGGMILHILGEDQPRTMAALFATAGTLSLVIGIIVIIADLVLPEIRVPINRRDMGKKDRSKDG